MPVFFLAQDDNLTRLTDVAWFAPPTGIIQDEQHSNTAQPTESPIETGAVISDHVIPGNAQLSIVALVTMTPHAQDVFFGAGRLMPLPLNIQRPYDPLRRGPPPGTPGFVTRTAMAAITGRLTPPIVTPLTLQFPVAFDPIITTFNKLDQFRQAGSLLKVLTLRRDYDEMVIASLVLRVSPQANAATFEVTCRQIETVSLQLVSAPVPLEPKAEPKLKKGNQPPATDDPNANSGATKRSAARAAFEKIFPGFLPAIGF